MTIEATFSSICPRFGLGNRRGTLYQKEKERAAHRRESSNHLYCSLLISVPCLTSLQLSGLLPDLVKAPRWGTDQCKLPGLWPWPSHWEPGTNWLLVCWLDILTLLCGGYFSFPIMCTDWKDPSFHKKASIGMHGQTMPFRKIYWRLRG